VACSCLVPVPRVNHVTFQLFSQGTNPLQVQPHLIRCFDGVSWLRFDEVEVGKPGKSSKRETKAARMWSRLKGESTISASALKERRRTGWKATLQRDNSIPEGLISPTAPLREHASGFSNVSKFAGLARAEDDPFAQASLTLMLASSLRRDREGKPLRLVVTAVGSGAGELVPLHKPVVPEEHGFAVEKWMGELERVMKESVRRSLVGCLNDGATRESDLHQWIQVILGFLLVCVFLFAKSCLL
jgi:hypothetical protein